MNLRILYELKKVTSEEYEQKLAEKIADISEIEFKFLNSRIQVFGISK